jgi:hypothetical protein
MAAWEVSPIVTATASAASVGGTFSGIPVVVIVVVLISGGVISGVVSGVISGIAIGAGDHDGLWRDEQRHVRGRLLCRGLYRGLYTGHSLGRIGGQQFPHPIGFSRVDAGLGTAGAAVDVHESIEYPPTGGAQCAGQRVNPQALGSGELVRLPRCDVRYWWLPLQRVFGQILGAIIIGH